MGAGGGGGRAEVGWAALVAPRLSSMKQPGLMTFIGEWTDPFETLVVK